MKVVVCVGDPTVRASVTSFVEGRGHEVIAATQTAFEAAEVAQRFRPDAVVIDPLVGLGGTVDAVDELYRVNVRFAVIVFTGHSRYPAASRPRLTVVPDHDLERLGAALEAVAPSHGLERRRASIRPGSPERQSQDVADTPEAFYAALEQAQPGDAIVAVAGPAVDQLVEVCRHSIRTQDFLLRDASAVLMLLLTDDADTQAVVKSRIRQSWPDPRELRIASATIADGELPATVLTSVVTAVTASAAPSRAADGARSALSDPEVAPEPNLPVGLASSFGAAPESRVRPRVVDAPIGSGYAEPASHQAVTNATSIESDAGPTPDPPVASTPSTVATTGTEASAPATTVDPEPTLAADELGAGSTTSAPKPRAGALAGVRALGKNERIALGVTVAVALIGIVVAVGLTGRSSGGKAQVGAGPGDSGLVANSIKAAPTLIDGVVSASDLGIGWSTASPPVLLGSAVYQAGPCASALWSSNVGGARSAFVKSIAGANNAEVIASVFEAATPDAAVGQRAFVASPAFLPCLKVDVGSQAKALFGASPQAAVKIDASPLSTGLTQAAAANQLSITVLAPNGPVTIIDNSVQLFSGPYEGTIDVSFCTCAPISEEVFHQVLNAMVERLTNLPAGGTARSGH